MFLLVQAYPVVPDKRPLNGCACVCYCYKCCSVYIRNVNSLRPFYNGNNVALSFTSLSCWFSPCPVLMSFACSLPYFLEIGQTVVEISWSAILNF